MSRRDYFRAGKLVTEEPSSVTPPVRVGDHSFVSSRRRSSSVTSTGCGAVFITAVTSGAV
jgi:hypothetical protein